jgi:hypothetical protein
MKKNIFGLTFSFSCLVIFCVSTINAEIGSSWDITTADTTAWKVANLLQANDYEFATPRAEITEEVFKNYLVGFSTVPNENYGATKGSEFTYGAVRETNSDSDYISPVDALGDDGAYSPGYYAFQTKFSLSSESDLSELFLNINIGMRVDNYLEGIFLNGQEITKYSTLKGADGMAPNENGLYYFVTLGFTGSVLLDDLIDQNLFLPDAENTLEFVLRNSSNSSGTDNGLKFAALGEINISDVQEFAHSFNPTTPEPGTMLIFLTCGGLALVAGRLRKCKK